jgi:protein gp37
MGDNTRISWCDATWPVVAGCSRVSAECDHCYAIADSYRMGRNPNEKIQAAYGGTVTEKARGKDWSGVVRLLYDRLDWPAQWRAPRRIFVCNESDLWHHRVPRSFIDAVVWRCYAVPQHMYLFLTKRAEQMAEYVCESRRRFLGAYEWPPRNAIWGVSIGDQETADERLPWLMEIKDRLVALKGIPAARTMVSYEPALGPVSFWKVYGHDRSAIFSADWIISGGESGPGARPAHPTWFRQVREQCRAAGVPYHHKQNGEWLHESQKGEAYAAGMHALALGHKTHTWPDGSFSAWVGKKAAGHFLDGVEHLAFPEVRAHA